MLKRLLKILRYLASETTETVTVTIHVDPIDNAEAGRAINRALSDYYRDTPKKATEYLN